jgi:hypothetical protein
MPQSIDTAERLFWDRIHSIERKALAGEFPTTWDHDEQRIIVPLDQSPLMIDAQAMLDELATAEATPGTMDALAGVQRAIDALALAVARDMMGS